MILIYVEYMSFMERMMLSCKMKKMRGTYLKIINHRSYNIVKIQHHYQWEIHQEP
jgi:hypothetical protein